jgi:hypothetical protein
MDYRNYYFQSRRNRWAAILGWRLRVKTPLAVIYHAGIVLGRYKIHETPDVGPDAILVGTDKLVIFSDKPLLILLTEHLIVDGMNTCQRVRSTFAD